MKGVTIKKL